MDNETLRKVQLCQLEIAKELRRVCNLLGTRYFLDSGTLLGAVRHAGFIPWDDDLDVGMLRADYERFIHEAPELLSPEFHLQTWHSDKNYGLAFAKLRLANSVYIENAAQFSKAENGIYIDIFPYDIYPDTPKERNWQRKRYNFYRHAMLVKSGYAPWINEVGVKRLIKKTAYTIIGVLASTLGREQIIRKYERACTKYNNKKTGYVYEQAGASKYGKWVIPDGCFTEFCDLPFEGELFTCPKDYDAYLKAAYGDYMKLPPESERVNRHRIIRVEFPDSIKEMLSI